ncbi:MAG: TlpA disulfide reductase family protein [bacterium]|nr:TlpA disulfide reductase family protein [bacterium]
MHSSFYKCQAVKNGYYEMTKHMKFMSSSDTLQTAFHCSYSKLRDDTLYTFAFNYRGFFRDKYFGDFMYTGKDFAKLSSTDSSAEILSTERWAAEIKRLHQNYTFYTPLTSLDSWPMKHDSDIIDPAQSFNLLKEEMINGRLAYHVRVIETPKVKSNEGTRDLLYTYDYWINKKDLIPIQYSLQFDVLVKADTLHQYEKFTLGKYELNNLKDQSMLSLNSIPNYYNVHGYISSHTSGILPLETLAPELDLNTLQGERIKARDLKGKLVLVNFFYTSSFPSTRAMGSFQRLYTTYKDKGLMVIGIDTYDAVAGDVSIFLKQKGITFPAAMGRKELAAAFRIWTYPTFYLINQKGKIIYSSYSFGPTAEKKLEELIKLKL